MDVTLTFDNGPDPVETLKVRDILARHGIRATFFLKASNLTDPACRRIAEQMRDDGHWIGNHTLNHKSPLGTLNDPEAPAREIGEAQNLLGPLAHPLKLFRPNGRGHTGPHLLSRAAVDYLVAGGYTCVLWSVMPRDGTDPPGWVDRAMAKCLAEPWPTVVIHDRVGGAMDYLDEFIRRIHDAGGRFRQDFNPEVTPIVQGRVMHPLDSFSNADPAAQSIPTHEPLA